MRISKTHKACAALFAATLVIATGCSDPEARTGDSSSAAGPSGAAAVTGSLEEVCKAAEQEAAEKKKAEDAKNAAVRAENCTRAKEQMRTLDSGTRITRTNEKGEREFLDDKARAQEVQRTREALASECSPQPRQ